MRDPVKVVFSITESGNSKTRIMETELSEAIVLALLQAFMDGAPMDLEI
jgi:hypothetical protein